MKLNHRLLFYWVKTTSLKKCTFKPSEWDKTVMRHTYPAIPGVRQESKNRDLSYLCLFGQSKDPELPTHSSALFGEFYQTLALTVDHLKEKHICMKTLLNLLDAGFEPFLSSNWGLGFFFLQKRREKNPKKNGTKRLHVPQHHTQYFLTGEFYYCHESDKATEI